jgi:hypothetical protein
MKLFHFFHNFTIALTCKLEDLGNIPVLFKQDITDGYKTEFQHYHDYPGGADVIYKKCTICDTWTVIITDGKTNYFCDDTLIHLRLEGLKKSISDRETNRLLAIDFDGVKNNYRRIILHYHLRMNHLETSWLSTNLKNETIRNKI